MPMVGLRLAVTEIRKSEARMEKRETELPVVVGESVLTPGFPGAAGRMASPADGSARGPLLALLTLQAAAFAVASASGKIPAVVIQLFRVLLTL
jgi:hypothetical protein